MFGLICVLFSCDYFAMVALFGLLCSPCFLPLVALALEVGNDTNLLISYFH